MSSTKIIGIHAFCLGLLAGTALSHGFLHHIPLGGAVVAVLICGTICALPQFPLGRPEYRCLLFLCGCAVATVDSHWQWRQYNRCTRQLDLKAANSVATDMQVTGWVVATPVNHGSTVEFALVDEDSCRLRVNAATSTATLLLRDGDLIQARGKITFPEPPRNPNAFNLQNYFRERRLHANMQVADNEISLLRSRAKGHTPRRMALFLGRHMTTSYEANLSETIAAFAAGATLGQKNALGGQRFANLDLREAFQRAGLSHVLAVSGLHVGILASTLYLLGRRLRFEKRLLAVSSVAILCLFAVVTGASPATIRAVTMASFVLMVNGFTSWKLLDAAWVGMSLSACLILLFNPLLLFAPSFQLSFAAVLSLLALTPPIERGIRSLNGAELALAAAWMTGLAVAVCLRPGWLFSPSGILAAGASLVAAVWLGNGGAKSRKPTAVDEIAHHPMERQAYPPGQGHPEPEELTRRPTPAEMAPHSVTCPATAGTSSRARRWLTTFIAAQLAIQIGTLVPLSAWYFGRFSVAGCVVNFAAIPLVGLFVQSALLTAIVGLVPLAGTILAWLPALATECLGRAFLALAWFGAKAFPYPAIAKPSLGQVAMYYGFVWLCFALLPPLRRRRKIALRGRDITAAWPFVPGLLLMVAGATTCLLAPRSSGDFATVLHVEAAPGRPAYPVVCGVRNGETFLVNCGDAYTAERIVFRYLCWIGKPCVNLALMPGASSRSGAAGLHRLADLLPVHSNFAADPTQVAATRGALNPPTQAMHLPPWVSFHPAVKGTGTLVVLELDHCRTAILTDANGTVAFDQPPTCDILIVPWKATPSAAAASRWRNAIRGTLASVRPKILIVADGQGIEASSLAADLGATDVAAPTVWTTSQTGAIRMDRLGIGATAPRQQRFPAAKQASGG